MKLTFVSNYINHHQIPVSSVLYEHLGKDYCFIQTERMAKERVAMGWDANLSSLPYVKLFYEEPQACKRLIMDSDVVIFGGTEEESYIHERLRSGKIVIRYSERLYREGQWKAISPRGLLKKYQDHTRYRKGRVYLLCSGAYVASDFHLVRAYPHKMLKWGYFTEVKDYNVDKLMQGKGSGGAPEILFAGRFLPLKHPEYGIHLAKRLQDLRIPFHMTYVGGGEMEEELHRMVREMDLTEKIAFAGYQKPEDVRRYMEKADIFLMTSNYLEGWGAVINESMNAGCAVIADAKIGAAPFLLRHGENGMVYRDGDLEEFLTYGQQMAEDPALCKRLGLAANETITSKWNPKHAAQSLLRFAEGLLQDRWMVQEEGPLSPALVISPGRGYSYTRQKRK